MKKDLEQYLVQKYPDILRDYHGNMKKTAMAFGFEHGDGWYTLVDQLMHFLQFHTRVNKQPEVIAHQIKQKFGSLCFYTNDDISKMQRGAIWFAETMSSVICETCGVIHTAKITVTKRSIHGYFQTLCDNCCTKRMHEVDEITQTNEE